MGRTVWATEPPVSVRFIQQPVSGRARIYQCFLTRTLRY